MKLSTLARAVALTATVSTAAFASPKYNLEFVDAFGTGCPDPSVISVEKGADGNFFINADFDKNAGPDAFSAATDGSKALARTDCTIKYNIRLNRGYKMRSASFSADGEYSLEPDSGRAFFSIRQNVPGVSNPQFSTVSYSVRNGDLLDDVWQLTGNFQGLSGSVNRCGATIPIEVQIRGTARRGRNAADDTFIAVFNGEGDTTAQRGYRRLYCFPIIVPC